VIECTACRVEKPESDFYRTHKQCKVCMRVKHKAYKEANPERVKEWRIARVIRDRKRMDEHRRKCRAKNRAAENARQQAYRDANRPKKHAWAAVARAVRSGLIAKPSACSRCGSGGRIEGSHHDYSKPLDVEWLCVICHRSKDQKLGMGPWAKRDNETWERLTTKE
jgi:hypothetical protein